MMLTEQVLTEQVLTEQVLAEQRSEIVRFAHLTQCCQLLLHKLLVAGVRLLLLHWT